VDQSEGDILLRTTNVREIARVWDCLGNQCKVDLDASELDPRDGAITLALLAMYESQPRASWALRLGAVQAVHIDDAARIGVYELDDIGFDPSDSCWRVEGTPLLEIKVYVTTIDVTLIGGPYEREGGAP
jgi:hypothetical protein